MSAACSVMSHNQTSVTESLNVHTNTMYSFVEYKYCLNTTLHSQRRTSVPNVLSLYLGLWASGAVCLVISAL
jgi:hypothetical protein